MICGSRRSKSRLAKAAGAECTFEMSKKWTPLWHEAHFQAKTHKTPGSDHFWKLRCRKSARRCGAKHTSKSKFKTHHARTTFGSWDVEKVHALVTRSTFRSQNAQNAPGPDHFWKLRCRKSARPCGAKHISKSKCTKRTRARTTFGSWDVEKVHAVVARSTFPSQKVKNTRVRTTFGRSDVVSRGRRKGLCTLSDVSKTWGFCSISKSDGRRGTFEEGLQRCIFRGRRSTRDMFIRAVRRSGRWFSWEGLHFGASDLQVCWDDFAWQVQHFVWPGITFSWQAQYFRQVDWKYRKTHWYEAVRSALNFLFLKDVSQNSFVFDVVNFQKWRSPAELLLFWRYQVQTLRKSPWIAALLMLPSSKIKEVSQNSFVSSLQIDR